MRTLFAARCWGDILDDNQIASLWAYVSSQRKL